jgi:hypothetical protein
MGAMTAGAPRDKEIVREIAVPGLLVNFVVRE